MVEDCTRDAIFCGTYSIAQHLQNYHGLFNEKQEDENGDDEDDDLTRANKRANKFLLKFIVTSFLPFTIIENTFFKL